MCYVVSQCIVFVIETIKEGEMEKNRHKKTSSKLIEEVCSSGN